MRQILFLLAILSPVSSAMARGQADAAGLVQQLAAFPAAIDPRVQSNTGRRVPAEERRDALYRQLRSLGDAATSALQRGLTDADVQVRRNVALYLGMEGGNYERRAPEPLRLHPFLPQLLAGLRDDDQRVKELVAQAIGYLGPDGVAAVPDLLGLLADPSEGLRNSACIGLAGIGPPARDALPALRRALSEPSEAVRRSAQWAIDRISAKIPGPE